MAGPTLLAAIANLEEVLERENSALTAMDLTAAAALLPRKTEAFTMLGAAAGSVNRKSPRLLTAVRRLDQLIRDNQRLLGRAIVAQERVIELIARAAASAARDTVYPVTPRTACVAAPVAFVLRT